MYALFLSHCSIHDFRNKESTTESCKLSVPEADILREQVKLLAQQQQRHPNSVWADLKRKYHFYSYKTIDCQTIEKIKKEIYKNRDNRKEEYIEYK